MPEKKEIPKSEKTKKLETQHKELGEKLAATREANKQNAQKLAAMGKLMGFTKEQLLATGLTEEDLVGFTEDKEVKKEENTDQIEKEKKINLLMEKILVRIENRKKLRQELEKLKSYRRSLDNIEDAQLPPEDERADISQKPHEGEEDFTVSPEDRGPKDSISAENQTPAIVEEVSKEAELPQEDTRATVSTEPHEGEEVFTVTPEASLKRKGPLEKKWISVNERVQVPHDDERVHQPVGPHEGEEIPENSILIQHTPEDERVHMNTGPYEEDEIPSKVIQNSHVSEKTDTPVEDTLVHINKEAYEEDEIPKNVIQNSHAYKRVQPPLDDERANHIGHPYEGEVVPEIKSASIPTELPAEDERADTQTGPYEGEKIPTVTPVIKREYPKLERTPEEEKTDRMRYSHISMLKQRLKESQETLNRTSKRWRSEKRRKIELEQEEIEKTILGQELIAKTPWERIDVYLKWIQNAQTKLAVKSDDLSNERRENLEESVLLWIKGIDQEKRKIVQIEDIERDEKARPILYEGARKVLNPYLNSVLKEDLTDMKMYDLRQADNNGYCTLESLHIVPNSDRATHEGFYDFNVFGFVKIIKNVDDVSKGGRPADANSPLALYKIVGPDGKMIKDHIVGNKKATEIYMDETEKYAKKIVKKYNTNNKK